MLAYFAKDSLYHVLNWFASYHDLFTRPCQRCHKLLQFDSPQYKYLPPMVRTWPKRTLDDSEQPLNVAYHMRCFTEYKNTRK
ncbi:hypothetical protein EDC96DRAFT_188338 [Choanephora cucurbitarum]|nr:hypothetical protein EDC96DRAFT_188338 [Choanephora cucurbitarum]